MDEQERECRQQDQHPVQQVEQHLILDDTAGPTLGKFDGSVDGPVRSGEGSASIFTRPV
jgi:hypothetical protein